MGYFFRNLKDGATYDVDTEIDHGAMALSEPEIKKILLDLIVEGKLKFGLKLWDFSIMDDHVHFLIKPIGGKDLSRFMQWFKCNSAKRWNKAHHTKGHLWGNRFRSHIIESKEDFEQRSALIDERPVVEKLVKEAKDWEFGGLYHKVNKIIGLVDEVLDGLLIFFPPTKAAGTAPV
jgi:putative transposase